MSEWSHHQADSLIHAVEHVAVELRGLNYNLDARLARIEGMLAEIADRHG